MKKLFSAFIVLVLVVSTVLCGCGNDNSATEDTTTATETTKTTAQSDSTKMLTKYYKSFIEGDNPLYGTWLIEGMNIPYFIFRNDNLAEMVMGGEGDFASLTIDTDKKTLSATFILGINGDYNYKLSKDEKTLTLTGSTDPITLKKQKDYNFIPTAPENPTIDSDILGWWKCEDGMIYYFGGDGIMYSNTISMETFYTYDAKDGKIEAIYEYGDDVNTDLEYSYKDNVLTIEGNKYEEYDPF
jgi:hypothetical protein